MVLKGLRSSRRTQCPVDYCPRVYSYKKRIVLCLSQLEKCIWEEVVYVALKYKNISDRTGFSATLRGSFQHCKKMVGAKSLGCLECKRRKVKVRACISNQMCRKPLLIRTQCDQRLPKCANCERLGRYCSGPKSRYIRFVRPGAEEHMNMVTTSQCGTLKCLTSTESDSLVAKLVRRLGDIENVGFQLQRLGEFIPFLPSRIGHNRALDAAVICLLQSHQSLLYHRKDLYTYGLNNYHKAVALIRKDINDRQTETPSETVCAALVLSFYEVC